MKSLLLTLVLALVCSSIAGARSAPAVRISGTAPLTVVGSSFAPREQLRLVVRYDGLRKVRSFRASVTGRFTARFAETTVEDRCNVTASVVRANGRTIAAKLPVPLCPLPLAP